MSLCRRYAANCMRKFSVCSQIWSENRIDVYGTKAVWNERERVKSYVKVAREVYDEEHYGDFREKIILTLQLWGRMLKYSGVFTEYLKERRIANEKYSQHFIQDRVNILGPDLAAAHFIISRGGSVKFWREKGWIGRNECQINIPLFYVPGYFIEAINAANTGLYYEGLECLYQLNKLKWLSLKGLENLNDFALDLISGHYGPQLQYLDLTGCTGITHLGLSSFYRFKQLKYLNVTGLNHTPEFKLTCLMLQDLLPDLQFQGIDFSESKHKEEKENEVKVIGMK